MKACKLTTKQELSKYNYINGEGEWIVNLQAQKGVNPRRNEEESQPTVSIRRQNLKPRSTGGQSAVDRDSVFWASWFIKRGEKVHYGNDHIFFIRTPNDAPFAATWR